MAFHRPTRASFAATLWLMIAVVPASAQTDVVQQVWMDGKPLAPLSRTAQSITGPLRFGPHTITFGSKTVPAAMLGTSRHAWNPFLLSTEQIATVFELSADPGPLIRKNTLCGGRQRAHYAVVYQQAGISGTDVDMEIWTGQAPPQDGSSPGHCGGYSYVKEH